MIQDSFPGINYPGQASVGHARGCSGASVEAWGWGGVLEPWASSDFFGKSWENSGRFSSPSPNPGSHRQGIPGISHHQTASFAGAPITTRERCLVTRLRARINVSCSRAGHKGAKGGGGTTKQRLRRTAKDCEGLRRRGSGTWTGQGQQPPSCFLPPRPFFTNPIFIQAAFPLYHKIDHLYC
jgi:hypothetical protein